MTEILVLYYSRNGATAQLARLVARGVEEIPGATARLRQVPPVAPVTQVAAPPVPDEGAPYVDRADLRECDGLVIGSPTRFGNMAAPLKHFLDSTAAEWASGTLVGKPAGCFASTGTMHGGQESTLLSMQIPLLHHGMLIVGIPFTEPALNATTTGGSPYGATHVAGSAGGRPISEHERELARVLGRRVADIARRLGASAAPGGGEDAAGRAHAARPWLLDVGGHHTDPWGRPRRPIRDFLPEVPSVTLDVTDNPLAGFIRGRGDALPFTSASFPLVCSVDVLEHVPPAARPLVLRELTRVSSRAIVLAAPFRHRDLDRAEALIAAFVLRTNGYVQGQLQEHREFGWPDLAETTARIAAEGWHVRVFPFGNLWRWALMMIDKHAAIAQPGGRAVQAQLDRRYNETLFAGDRSLPCYRHFIFATRDAGDPLLAWSAEAYGAVADAAVLAPQTSAAEADRLFDLLHLHAQNQTLQAQTEPLRRDTHLAELEARYAEQQRCLEAEARENARLVQLLRDVEQSPAYRVGSLLRRFGRTGR